jgi:predicted small metal-binding protein
MARELRCRDLGIECNVVIRAETEEALIEKVAQHALAVHGFDVTDPYMLEQIKAVIYTTKES